MIYWKQFLSAFIIVIYTPKLAAFTLVFKVTTAADKLFLVGAGQAAEIKSLCERKKKTVIRSNFNNIWCHLLLLLDADINHLSMTVAAVQILQWQNTKAF